MFEPFLTAKEVGKRTQQGLAIDSDAITRKHGCGLTFTTIVQKDAAAIIRRPFSKGREL